MWIFDGNIFVSEGTINASKKQKFHFVNDIINFTYVKERLNSVDQQLHEYQQNEQSPMISNHWPQENTRTCCIWDPGPGTDTKKVDAIPIFPTNTWISFRFLYKHYIFYFAECPTEVNILYIILGVVVGIVVVGLALLLIWKLFTTISDRRELARFESETKEAKWDTVSIMLFYLINVLKKQYLLSLSTIFYWILKLFRQCRVFSFSYSRPTIMQLAKQVKSEVKVIYCNLPPLNNFPFMVSKFVICEQLIGPILLE